MICAIAVGVLAVTIGVEVREPKAYTQLRHLYRDAVVRAGRTTPPNPDLVFLAIDSDSVGLEQETDLQEFYEIDDPTCLRALSLMTQRYPWPREVYALILDRLMAAGARVVVFDLTFPSATADDPLFRAALERYRDRVVVGSNFVDPSWSGGFQRIGASHTRPTDTLIPQDKQDDRVAFTNFWPDADDVVRNAQYRVTFEQVQGRSPTSDSEVMLSLAAQALTKAGFGEKVPAGLEARGLRFTAPPRQGFLPRSIFEIFVPEYWTHNFKSGESLRDKIILIGAEGNWQHDEHLTPFGIMAGPEIHLNALNAAFHGEFLSELPLLAVIQLTTGAALVAVVLALLVRSPWLRPFLLILLNAGAGGFALYAFDHLDIYIPLIGPLACLNAATVFGLVGDFAFERVEKGKVLRTLERYVSSDVAERMLNPDSSYERALGGVSKPVTILFSDVRGFSRIAAAREPQVLVGQLNEYFTAMVDCVFRHGGTIDKFIGDAVMAVWGSVHTAGLSEDAVSALHAALDMERELARLNQNWRKRGWPELTVGIAINHGDAIVGNVGSPKRMEFTVIGDAVNVTWKLQEMTKTTGCSPLVSASVRQLAAEFYDFDLVDRCTIPGLSGEIEIFAPGERLASSSAQELAEASA